MIGSENNGLLEDQYKNMTNEDLIKNTTVDKESYQPEAIELMLRELGKRNISQIAMEEQNIHIEKQIDEKNNNISDTKQFLSDIKRCLLGKYCMDKQKYYFVIFCIVFYVVNCFHIESSNFNAIIYGALGGSVVEIPVFIIIGYILINILLSIIYLFKPNINFPVTIWSKANVGIVLGILLKIFF